jgi:hypothetical protein
MLLGLRRRSWPRWDAKRNATAGSGGDEEGIGMSSKSTKGMVSMSMHAHRSDPRRIDPGSGMSFPNDG